MIKAELWKLFRPLSGLTVAGLSLLCVLTLGLAQRSIVARYSQQLVPNEQRSRHTPCVSFSTPDHAMVAGLECDAARTLQFAADKQSYAQMLVQTRADEGRVAGVGSGGYAAGMAASLFGALGVMVLAAAHIAGEWSGRTAKTLFVQENRRGRVVLAKFGSVWLAAIVMMLGMWVAVALGGQVLLRVFPTPLHASLPAQWDYAAPQLGRAVLVLGAFAAIGTLAAVIARNTIGSFFGASMVILVLLSFTLFGATLRWSPAFWIAGWMGFTRDQTFVDHFWSDAGLPFGSSINAILLVSLVGACLGASILLVRKTDVV